ncbi:predicted protein [Postia placenta Mad-698-R]|nr:predicted protein [Postia placenta Mad-698-R]
MLNWILIVIARKQSNVSDIPQDSCRNPAYFVHGGPSCITGRSLGSIEVGGSGVPVAAGVDCGNISDKFFAARTAGRAPERRARDHPFTRSTADIKFVTADGVEFKVHSVILSEASPLWESMFRLPQPRDAEGETSSDIPAIEVTEDSVTINNLLSMCYPMQRPVLYDLDEVRDTLKAAIKYDVPHVITLLKEWALSFLRAAPLRVYDLACYNDCEDVALEAARVLLSNSSQLSARFPMLYKIGMEHLTAGCYERLLGYCKAGGRVDDNYRFCSPQPDQYAATESHEGAETEENLSNFLRPHAYDMAAADLVLRPGDSVEFEVHRLVMAASSPVFRDMLSSSSGRPADAAPVQLSVPACVVAPFLKLCYGQLSDEIVLHDVREALLLYATAQKYQVPSARVDAQVDALIDRDPLRAYFAAYCYRLEAQANCAARKLFGRELVPGTWCPEMETAPALAYHRLFRFLQACGENAARLTNDVRWLPALCALRINSRCIEKRQPAPSDPDARPWTGAVPTCWWTPLMREHMKKRLTAGLDIRMDRGMSRRQ